MNLWMKTGEFPKSNIEQVMLLIADSDKSKLVFLIADVDEPSDVKGSWLALEPKISWYLASPNTFFQ